MTGLRYDQLLLRGRPGGRWPILGLVVVVFVFTGAQLVLTVVFLAGYAVGGVGSHAAMDRLTTDVVTPGTLAFVNLNLAVLIPASIVALVVVHRLRPGWAVSVVGRFRWRWFSVALVTAFLALAATIVVSAVVPSTGDDTTSGSLHSFTHVTLEYVLVILVLTPLQAAGEEFGFRGYLMQAISRFFAWWPRGASYVAVLVSAGIFALAHGATQGWPIFLDRFAFGVVAAVLVILTGGLEAGIAMHVLNNFLAFGLALAFGNMYDALHASGGTWWELAPTLTQSFVFLGLTVFAARRMGIATHTSDAPDTELVGV